MIGISNGNTFLDFAKIDFKCPKCEKLYTDEKYFNRCEKNKSGITKVKCSCGNKIKLIINYKSEIQIIQCKSK